METCRLLFPGYPGNWKSRESLPDTRMLLLGQTLLLGRHLSSDAGWHAMMGCLTMKVAGNDHGQPWDAGDGL